MGTLVWLRPTAAPAVPAGPSAAHGTRHGSTLTSGESPRDAAADPILSGVWFLFRSSAVVSAGGIKGRPRRVSVASRCPNPRVLQAGRCRWLVVRSGVTAAATTADDPEDSSRLSGFRPPPLSRAKCFELLMSVPA